MNRRDFIVATGELVVAFAWSRASAQESNAQESKLPGSLAKEPMLDGWIRIDSDSAITVFTGKVELGQGIKTALIQIAAEQLAVAPERIALVTADTERTANEGFTSGSHSMQDSGTAIRQAAFQVRGLLLQQAAQRWQIPLGELSIDDGRVSGRGRSAAYGELIAGEVLHVKAKPAVEVTDTAHKVSGKSLPRIDIPAKVSGGSAYVQDLRLDGMVHARVIRPPSASATLETFSPDAAAHLPGVLKVVRDGRFIGVVAEGEWQAIVAMRALSAALHWRETATLPRQADLPRLVRAAPAKDDVILQRGDVSADRSDAGTVVESTYSRPYQMHGSIGPSCAIARFADGKFTVWTHSQGVFPLRKALAELLRVQVPSVHCIHVEGSGCYGHNGADDVAADAALLARAVPGRAVRVQWMREDEHRWEPLGPPMVANARATLDHTGAIVDWRYEVWSNTHSTRPGGAGDLVAGTLLAEPFAPTPPKPIPQPEGGGDRNAIPIYASANARVVHHFLPQMPLRVSALRSLGAYMNVFAIESFMDELAHSSGGDAVDFRMRNVADPRAQEVMRTASDRFRWADFQRRPGRGRGFAFARYKNLAAYCAIACEVEVWRESGEVRIERVVAAVDSGEAVNPDGIRNQIEGGIVQSASWTLMEQVTFDDTRITSVDWGGYPILRFPQVPVRIDVHIVDRPGAPFLGTGEASQGPAAAAIANAVADATGVRLRDLPLSRSRLREAMLTTR
jgi:CO/xanthine dehydrogenase Mo-binding subunit